MSEVKTPIRSLNGHSLVDEQARADIASIKGAMSENEYRVDGQLVEIDGIDGEDVHVVTKFENVGTTDALDKYTSLLHVNGAPLFDLLYEATADNKLTGTSSEGISWSIDTNASTIHFSGNASKFDNGMTYKNIFTLGFRQHRGAVVFPAGKYKTGGSSENGAYILVGVTGLNSKSIIYIGQEGVQLDEPFRLTSIIFRAVKPTLDYTCPIYLAHADDNVVDCVFRGALYSAKLSSPVENGTFDWTTGELKDESGNVIETVEVPTITGYAGKNTFINARSTITVSGKKNTSTANQTTTRAFDPFDYDVPVLALIGSTDGMSKDDAVEMRYVYGDKRGSCSVKWQGSSSLSFPKKNYTVVFDTPFEAVEGWGEQKKYCLKANYVDYSHARNTCGAKLWGQIVKSRENVHETLAASPNYGAIDGFPVAITINGEFGGLYTFNIPKDGWMANMGDGTQEAIICAEGTQRCYMREPVVIGTDYDIEYVSDEDNADWIQTSINALIDACANTDSSDIDTTIAERVDWDSVIDMLAFTALVGGFDLIIKNYLLFTYNGTKWHMGAYDMDSIWGNWWNGKYILPADDSTVSFAGTALRHHRLYGLALIHKKDEFKARYAELRAGVMSEINVAKVIDDFVAGIPAVVRDEDARLWTKIPNTLGNNVHQIKDWYRLRCQIIDKQVEAL